MESQRFQGISCATFYWTFCAFLMVLASDCCQRRQIKVLVGMIILFSALEEWLLGLALLQTDNVIWKAQDKSFLGSGELSLLFYVEHNLDCGVIARKKWVLLGFQLGQSHFISTHKKANAILCNAFLPWKSGQCRRRSPIPITLSHITGFGFRLNINRCFITGCECYRFFPLVHCMAM